MDREALWATVQGLSQKSQTWFSTKQWQQFLYIIPLKERMLPQSSNLSGITVLMTSDRADKAHLYNEDTHQKRNREVRAVPHKIR